MRASIYNAVPEEAIDELINFMKDFSSINVRKFTNYDIFKL